MSATAIFFPSRSSAPTPRRSFFAPDDPATQDVDRERDDRNPLLSPLPAFHLQPAPRPGQHHSGRSSSVHPKHTSVTILTPAEFVDTYGRRERYKDKAVISKPTLAGIIVFALVIMFIVVYTAADPVPSRLKAEQASSTTTEAASQEGRAQAGASNVPD